MNETAAYIVCSALLAASAACLLLPVLLRRISAATGRLLCICGALCGLALDTLIICAGLPLAVLMLMNLPLLALLVFAPVSRGSDLPRGIGAAVVAALIVVPVLLTALGAFALPSQYSESYLGELAAKVERLDSAGEGKIVIVGGSSVAFGVDCKMIKEYTGREAVNFGLYATLGTEVMLELTRDALAEGDTVVIAPETDAQTLSRYFNAEAVWQASDGHAGLLCRLPANRFGEMLGGIYDFASGKLSRGIGYSYPASGIYGSASFDEYGDITVPLPENIMLLGYDPMQPLELSADAVSDDFIAYINKYVAYAAKRGATVYFSFPPMNKAALSADATPESINAFYDYLASVLDCPVITNPSECLMGAGYFYDTNYHTNDSGKTVNTARLIGDILAAGGITAIPVLELPAEPALPGDRPVTDPSGSDADTDCFVYEQYGSGLLITGVTPEAQSRTSLTIPVTHGGTAVVALGDGALAGCDVLTTLTVGNNIRQFFDGAFAGAPKLARIVVTATDPEGMAVGEKLFRDAADGARMIFTKDAYEKFTGNYAWYEYSDRFVIE